MKLDLKPLIKNETGALDFQFCFKQPDIDYYGDTITFDAPVEVKGTAKKISDQMYLETEIAARMTTHCARCLQEVQREFLVKNLDELMPAGKESQTEREENVLFYEGHQIDLVVYAQEQVMVTLPIKSLCRDNCAGICTTCGSNLNEEPCHCKPGKNAEKELDPRLAQLRDWLQKANE